MLAELWKRYKGKWWVWGGIVSYLICCIFLSKILASEFATNFTDFSGFYLAGQHFFNGEPLYGEICFNIPAYFYPPFSATILQLLTVFSYQNAFAIINFINLILYPVAIITVNSLIVVSGNQVKKSYSSIILTIFATAIYFWLNLKMGQVNLIIFILCVIGITCYIKELYTASSVIITFATCFKVIPVIILFWLIFRKFNLRILITSIITSLLLFIIPFFFRGFYASITDLQEFIINVIQPYLFKSGIDVRTYNQSLTGAFGRLMLDIQSNEPFYYNIFNLNLKLASTIILLFKLFLFLLFFLIIKRKSINSFKPGIIEISLLFLLLLLLSSLTWPSNFITLLLILFPLFNRKLKYETTIIKGIIYILYFLVFGLLIFNRYLFFGETVKYFFYGFSFYTWMLLILFSLYIIWLYIPQKKYYKI